MRICRVPQHCRRLKQRPLCAAETTWEVLRIGDRMGWVLLSPFICVINGTHMRRNAKNRNARQEDAANKSNEFCWTYKSRFWVENPAWKRRKNMSFFLAKPYGPGLKSRLR